MKRKMTILMTLSLSLLIAGTALAQPNRGQQGEMTPERMEKFKEKRGKLLREKVGLAEAKAIRVEAVLDRFKEERHKLRQQVRKAKQALKALLDEDSQDQRAYQNHLDVLLAVRTSMHELHIAEINELRGLLTPKESTKLLFMMERVHKRMRGLRHKTKERCKDGDCTMKGRKGSRRGPGGFGAPLF